MSSKMDGQTRAACLVDSSRREHSQGNPFSQQQATDDEQGGGRVRCRVSKKCTHSPCLETPATPQTWFACVAQGQRRTESRRRWYDIVVSCVCDPSLATPPRLRDNAGCDGEGGREISSGMCLLIARTRRLVFGLQASRGWRRSGDAACKSFAVRLLERVLRCAASARSGDVPLVSLWSS